MRNPITGLTVLALALGLAACGPEPVPEPREVETPDAPLAVVDADQLASILTAVTETLAAADAAFNVMVGQRMAPFLTSMRALKQSVVDSFSSAMVPAFERLSGVLDAIAPLMEEGE